MQPSPPDRRNALRRHELPEALARCSASIARHFRGEIREDAMRDAVRGFAEEMCRLGVPPERALSQLKEGILRVPEVAMRPAVERGDLLKVLVETAIHAYYAPPGTARM